MNCRDCGGRITRRSATGRCQLCNGRAIGRVYGPVYGRANVESGHLARIRKLPQSKQTKEAQRAAGWATVESGHLARIRKLPQSKQTKEAQRAAGRISGRVAVESGRLFEISRGIPCATVDGEYKTASMDEAAFYAAMLELGGEPYQPLTIVLPDGRSYTPDFALKKSVLGLPANVPLELKHRKSYWNGNIEKAHEAGATIIYYEDIWV